MDQESPSLDQLKGPLEPVPLPSPSLVGWWWFAAAGLLLATGMASWYFRLRRQPAAPPPTARELAMRELDALWQSDTPRAEVKVYYVELTGIVRRYIERTTNVHAPEQTTEEFLQEIGRGMSFSREERQRLKDFLESADLVKFARHQPDFSDITESFQRARRFVGLTEGHREHPA